MLDHNLAIIPNDSLRRTPFTDFCLLAMLDDNPASRASAMGCSTYMRFSHCVVASHAGIGFNSQGAGKHPPDPGVFTSPASDTDFVAC
jgi:hypothetical protein